MRVHHLNCGTLTPTGTGRMVCHVLLVESDDGLVLVDTGIGQRTIDDPGPRLGPARHLLGFALDPAETALAQIRRLGLDPADVRHVVLTHLDFDHAGGIADFPDATVHTAAAEHDAAVVAPLRRERSRYRPAQWAHGPRFELYDGPGDMWLGFGAAWPVRGLDGRVVLVPLPGHTRGHAAVAVDDGAGGWLVHAGDAFFHRSTVDRHAGPVDRRARTVLAFESLVAASRSAVRANHERLAELASRDDAKATVFCAHDPVMFDALAGEPALA